MCKFKAIFALAVLMGLNNLAHASGAGAGVSDGVSVLDMVEIEQELMAAPEEVRNIALSSKERLVSLIKPVFVDKRVAAVAKREGFLNEPGVQEAIDRSIRSTIVKIYLRKKLDEAMAKLDEKKLEALARERYETEKKTLQVPESIRVSHILFAINPEDATKSEPVAKEKAEKVLLELKSGGDFAKLARAYSDDKGSAGNGGELPNWMQKGSLVEPFEKAAYLLKPNEISGLVRTRFGIHIIKLVDYKAAHLKSYDEVKADLLNQVKDKFVSASKNEIMREFYGEKEPNISDNLFEELVQRFKSGSAGKKSN